MMEIYYIEDDKNIAMTVKEYLIQKRYAIFLGFSIMICFTTLANISTGYTYFERYQDMWDIKRQRQ